MIGNRTDAVLTRCEVTLRAHYEQQRAAINAALGAEGERPYEVPAIAAENIAVRAQAPARKQEPTGLRIIPVPQVARPSGVSQQARNELPVAVACVVRAEDCAIADGEDTESALVRAAYATTEAVRLALTGLANQQEQTVLGHAGVGGVISAQVEHDLHLVQGKDKEVVGVIVLLTVVFRQKTRV